MALLLVDRLPILRNISKGTAKSPKNTQQIFCGTLGAVQDFTAVILQSKQGTAAVTIRAPELELYWLHCATPLYLDPAA